MDPRFPAPPLRPTSGSDPSPISRRSTGAPWASPIRHPPPRNRSFVNPRPPVPRDVLQHALQAELPFVALATLVSAVGLAALMLWRLRSRDPLLLWLGVLASLYG